MLSVGNTFLIPTPPNNQEHLFIIIAIDKNTNAALLVYITTPKINCDYSCFVNVGEHPFLKYISVVDYADARITPISNLEFNTATSKKTELKLTGVARASLEELLLDYEDFLRQRGLCIWDKNSHQALAVRKK